MSESAVEKREQWRHVTGLMDGWLVPASFGLLSVLVLAQAVCAIPVVRTTVDRAAGRFVPVSSLKPQEATTAQITLYLSPAVPHPDVRVMVNNKFTGTFARDSVRLTVHPGDSIRIVAPRTSGKLTVSVDDNNPYLLYPLPGLAYTLSGNSPTLQLPNVRFSP